MHLLDNYQIGTHDRYADYAFRLHNVGPRLIGDKSL